MFHFNPWRVIWGKTIGRKLVPNFSYDEIVQGEIWACTDLGAYRKPLQNLKGISGVVIMEDRFPEFFLSYDHFEPQRGAKLNRQGPLNQHRTQQDLKLIVQKLHEQGIEVLLGFWSYFGWKVSLYPRPKWFREHPEVKPVPQTGDIDPFVILKKEGMSYADYIANQYRKLQHDFGFDGLFLADGLSGYRSFTNPHLYRDKSQSAHKWQELYRIIASSVHESGGKLFNFDCLGLSYEEAKLHGADYKLFSQAGLDYLVFQSYPQAWGEYWLSHYKNEFDLEAAQKKLKSVVEALRLTQTKVLYSVELGDSVEGWQGNPPKTRLQMKTHDPLVRGRFLVWANNLFARL